MPIQRSLSLAPDVLAVLAEQELITLRWGEAEPKILSKLELARNLTWLQLQDDKLWAAAHGSEGIHRFDLWATAHDSKGFHHFYRYTMDDMETPAQSWQLPKLYTGLQMDKNLVVFYDYSHTPLVVQVLDTDTGKLHPVQQLENIEENTSDPKIAVERFIDSYFSGRSQPLVHNGWFYVAEQRPYQTEDYYWLPQWVLRSWDLTVTDNIKEAETRQIPGFPLAFMANGELITQEYAKYPFNLFNEEKQYRLNLLALGDNKARLLQSRVISCLSSQFIFANDAVYVSCHPLVVDNNEPITQILKLNPGQGFIEDENWTLSGYQILRGVSGDIALFESVLDRSCNVSQLLAGQEPKLISHFDGGCPSPHEEGILHQMRKDGH